MEVYGKTQILSLTEIAQKGVVLHITWLDVDKTICDPGPQKQS